MEKVNLKKGLFGYTQSSVREYIEALRDELASRSGSLARENEQLKKKCEVYEDKINEASAKQEELLDKINALSKDTEAYLSDKSTLLRQIDELNRRLDEAGEGRADYDKSQNDLADVMLEAKRFADDLKQKTEIEYELKKAENDDKISRERERIEKYISNIDGLSSILRKVCDDFGAELGKGRTELKVVLENLNELNAKEG